MRSSNDEVAVKQCPFFSFPLSTPKIFPALHLAAEPRKDSATANWAAALLHINNSSISRRRRGD
ncbi:hypothetical protein HID58_055024 [Brassica napus]|uniref:Uncharacterized protein n=1 Tax=Brassica napus TaxID=3708 RepID=A0ABQ8AJB1_BRANA|nr:hypothetical protein HID58_055024 [Brassica napus]